MLESDTFCKSLPLIASRDNIVDLVWTGDEKWRIEAIYGKKTISKSTIEGLFLQLISNRILILRRENNGPLTWHFGTTIDTDHPRERLKNYKLPINWVGINTL